MLKTLFKLPAKTAKDLNKGIFCKRVEDYEIIEAVDELWRQRASNNSNDVFLCLLCLAGRDIAVVAL
eukprot:XP_001709002.1 Hypothetical protein GL50803_38907 [Giardia lamblia ATCC 50803]